MATRKLTALTVERAHRQGLPVMLSDGAWTLRFRFADHSHWMTLGNFPEMSLAAARDVVRAITE